MRVVPSEVVGFLDQVFPQAQAQVQAYQTGGPFGGWTIGWEFSQQLRGLLVLVDNVPDNLLVMPSELARTFLVAKEAIRARTREWEYAGRQTAVSPMSGFEALNPISWIRLAMAACPDAQPSTAVHALAFVTDNDLREALRIDIDTVYRALANQEWKPATVLAGSVIEALLLWALTEHESRSPGAAHTTAAACLARRPPADLDRWELHQLLAVTKHLTIITDETFMAGDLARNFRNLIHPGRAQRLAETCTRGTAYSAVGGMERVIDDLS